MVTGKEDTLGVHIDASTKPLATTKTGISIESPTIDNTKVNKSKSAEDTTMKSLEAQTETSPGKDTEKPIEQ